jgi:hypothetical protein
MVHSLAGSREVGEVTRKLKSYRILPDSEKPTGFLKKEPPGESLAALFLFNIHV